MLHILRMQHREALLGVPTQSVSIRATPCGQSHFHTSVHASIMPDARSADKNTQTQGSMSFKISHRSSPSHIYYPVHLLFCFLYNELLNVFPGIL